MSTETLFQAMKESQFGKTLVGMLTLKFQTSEGQLARLNEVLEELEDSLEQQQAENDQAYQARSTDLQDLIAQNENVIDSATSNLAGYNGELATNQNDLSQANQNLVVLQQHYEFLVQSLADLNAKREKDTEDYNDRVQRQQLLLAGLQRVIQLFEAQQSNPALAKPAVAEILSLLESLVDAFEASIANDAAIDAQETAAYNPAVAEYQANIDEDTTNINDLNVAIPQIQATIDQLESNIASEEQRLENSEQLLAQYQEELQTLTSTYTSNSATRREQLRLLGLVQVRLSENPEDVQEVLSNA